VVVEKCKPNMAARSVRGGGKRKGQGEWYTLE